MISEFGSQTDDNLSQYNDYKLYVTYFKNIEVDYILAWFWRADYEKGAPDTPGSGYNLAENTNGEYRQAFSLLSKNR